MFRRLSNFGPRDDSFVEDVLKALNENPRETEEERKPEPATEVLFLCSYEGCGRTFIDAGTLKKHANVHGEKQHVCQFEGCGKVFYLILIDNIFSFNMVYGWRRQL